MLKKEEKSGKWKKKGESARRTQDETTTKLKMVVVLNESLSNKN